jgi:hypothetical protein
MHLTLAPTCFGLFLKPSSVGSLTVLCQPWLISNLMHKILIYLYIIHLLKSTTCFKHYPAHLREFYVVIVYIQSLVSPLSAGDCTLHWLRKKIYIYIYIYNYIYITYIQGVTGGRDKTSGGCSLC